MTICEMFVNVKLTLFGSFCMCVYDISLWNNYSVTVLSKIRASYIK